MDPRLDAAKKVATYATELIHSFGIPKGEWLDVFHDAENLFVADNELDQFSVEGAVESGPPDLPVSPEPFNAEDVQVITAEATNGLNSSDPPNQE